MCGPSRLGDHHVFPARSLRDLFGPALYKVAGILGKYVAVEEGVAVDGAKVGGLAELGVGFHGDHGVDCDHRTIVARGFECRFNLADSCSDLTDRGSTVVDQFVADADCIDKAPITVDGAGNCFAFICDAAEIKYAEEELDVFSLCCSDCVRDLVAVRAI